MAEPRTVTVTTSHRVGERVSVRVPFRYSKGGYSGRWNIDHAGTGQHLGWVVRTPDGWAAYVANGAYYPAGTDIMVSTTQHRSHRAANWAEGEAAGVGDTRDDVVIELVYKLVDRDAESLRAEIDEARQRGTRIMTCESCWLVDVEVPGTVTIGATCEACTTARCATMTSERGED